MSLLKIMAGNGQITSERARKTIIGHNTRIQVAHARIPSPPREPTRLDIAQPLVAHAHTQGNPHRVTSGSPVGHAQ
jgi:hypothetical protein